MLGKFRRRLLGAMLLGASPFMAAGAWAEPISGGEAMVVLRSMGLSPELGVDDAGDPQIEFRINGLHSQLRFYDCRAADGRCGSLQLQTAVDLDDGISFSSANRFNRQYRYVRLYLDEEMDPWLQYDFEVLHSDAVPHLRSQLEMFGKLLDSFKDHLGF